jgi:hypothetical protein
MWTYILTVLFIIGFIGIYILATHLNSKVAIPKECMEAYLEAQACETCASRSGGSCGYSAALEFMKEVKI